MAPIIGSAPEVPLHRPTAAGVDPPEKAIVALNERIRPVGPCSSISFGALIGRARSETIAVAGTSRRQHPETADEEQVDPREARGIGGSKPEDNSEDRGRKAEYPGHDTCPRSGRAALFVAGSDAVIPGSPGANDDAGRGVAQNLRRSKELALPPIPEVEERHTRSQNAAGNRTC